MKSSITGTYTHNEEEGERKANTIASFYRYSELSVEAMADQLDMNVSDAQKIIDELTMTDALEMFVEQSTTWVEKIMTRDVACMDCYKTALDAATLMAERRVGSVIVTKDERPFGIVTEKDIVRRVCLKDMDFKDVKLEDVASRPLITAEPRLRLEDAAKIMSRNNIHKLPVVSAGSSGRLQGMITLMDLTMLLLPLRRPGFALSILRALSRYKT
jgi:CBS domain-containing protein